MNNKKRGIFRRIVCVMLCICLLLPVLSGCDDEEVVTTGKKFKAVLTKDPSNLDPQHSSSAVAKAVFENIFEGLTRKTSDGKIVEGVAYRWETNEDFTQYTFYLRENAKWSNGEYVTANDFLFAIKRALNKKTASPDVSRLFVINGAQALYLGEGSIEELGVTVVADNILKIELNEPSENFVELASDPIMFPCNEEFFNSCSGAYGMEGKYVLSNGPFCFRKNSGWVRGEYLYLVKNKNYHSADEVLPSAVQFMIGDVGDPIDALSKGDVNVLPITEAQSNKIKNDKKSELSVMSFETGTTGIIFNCRASVFSVEIIRNLLIEAVVNEKISTAAGKNQSSHIVPSAMSFEGKNYRMSAGILTLPKAETETLAERMSGALSANKISSLNGTKVLFIDTPENRAAVNLLITAWYRTFGFYINMEPLDEKTYAKRISDGNFGIAFGTVSSSEDSVEAFLRAVCKNAGYTSQALNGLGEDISVDELYSIEQELVDRGAFYPMLAEYSYYAKQSTVTGLEINPFGDAIYFKNGERE